MTEVVRCTWCGNQYPEGTGLSAPNGDMICRQCAKILGWGQ